MKKFAKVFFWILAGLVGLLAVAVVLVLFVVDPNDYKDEIAQLVKEKTGRDLTFTGDISLSFFPWLGVELEGVRLSNAPGFGDEPMLDVGKAGVSVRVAPLLSGDVEIGTVRLSDVRVNLAVNPEGVSNWDDLAALGEDNATAAAPATAPTDNAPTDNATAEDGGGSLRLGGVEVTNLALVYDDQASGQRYQLEELSLNVGEVSPDLPFDIDLAAKALLHLNGEPEPDLTAQLTLTGQADLGLDTGIYAFTNLALKAQAEGPDVPGGQAELDLAADAVRLDLDEDGAELEGFTLHAYGATATGFLALSDLSGELTAAGAVELAQCDARQVLAALGVDPPETTDPEALSAVAASAQFAYRSDVLTSDKLELTVDQSSVKASLNITGLSDVPAYSFVAVIDDLDLDRYLPPPGDKADAASSDANATAANTTEGQAESGETKAPGSPVEPLRTLTLGGQASVGRLKLGGGEFTDVSLTVSVKDGVLTVEPLTLSCYGGKVQAAYVMDAGPTRPLSSLEATVSRVHIGQALKALTGRAYISGILNLTTTKPLTFQGLDGKSIRKTLAGGFDFTALEGTLPSGGIASDILTLSSTLLFTSGTPPSGDTIAYDSITATSRISKGVIRNDYLILKSPSLWARGAGLINLDALTIDYQASTKLVSDPDPDEDFDDVTAPEVAVYASGPLADPAVETGVLEGLGNLGVGVVTGVGESAWDVVKGVGQAAGEFVEGLFDSGSNDSDSGEQEAKPEQTSGTKPESEPKKETNVLEDIGKSLGIEF